MNDKNRKLIAAGALLSALSVMLGAFAAHGLKEKIPTDHLQVFEVAVRYQFYHSIALLILGIAVLPENFNRNKTAIFFIIGIILFSGSLYLVSLRTLFNAEGLKMLGMITPLGGISFICGWLLFAYQILKKS